MVEYFADPGVGPSDFLKSMAVFDGDGRPTLLLVPGDREARLPSGWRLFEDADFADHPSLVKGYIGPIGQQAHGIRVVGDLGAARVDTIVVWSSPTRVRIGSCLCRGPGRATASI